MQDDVNVSQDLPINEYQDASGQEFLSDAESTLSVEDSLPSFSAVVLNETTSCFQDFEISKHGMQKSTIRANYFAESDNKVPLGSQDADQTSARLGNTNNNDRKVPNKNRKLYSNNHYIELN